MFNNTINTIIILLFLLVPHAIAKESITSKECPIPDHGVLKLSMPTSWESAIGQPPGNLPPTIAIRPKNGNIFYIKITAFWNLNNSSKFNEPERIKELVTATGNNVLPSAEESKLIIKEISGTENKGYYFTVTDKNPKPDEYKYMSQGAISVKELQLVFIILTHSKDSEHLKMAISMLENAKQLKKQ